MKLPWLKITEVPTWTIRVLGVNFIQLSIVLLAGVTWEKWFNVASLFRLSDFMSPALAGVIAYIIATFVFYWWHKWRHTFDFLWLGFHPIHHSPQRLEMIISFYKHRLEMTVNWILGRLVSLFDVGT